MVLIDTHTHLYLEPFDNDRNEVIERSINYGINKMLLPDIDNKTRHRMLAVSQQFKEHCFYMIGLHPTSVKKNYQDELNLVKIALQQTSPCAIGECGLDYYWDKTFAKEQKDALVEQFYLAHQYRLPLVIHSRKSLDDVIQLLKTHKNLNLTGVFHCYPGGINEAKFLFEQGFYIGVGGVVTYKNALLAEVVKYLPLEAILLETDAPFLSPVPYRGKRNESAYLYYIAQKIAELKNISIEEVANVTTQQAYQLFKIQ